MSALLKMRDYQVKAIRSIHEKWDAGVTRPAVVLPTGSGKGHPLDTEIITPDGLRAWGDLKSGDLVFGSDGSSTEVTAVHDRGVLPTYRVTLSDGTWVEVDGDHLWRVRDNKHRRTSREYGVIETRKLIGSDLKLDRGYRWHIPMAAPRDAATSNPLPLDPYLVGSLIANGGLAGVGTMLTTPDRDVAARVGRVTEMNKIKDQTPGICDRYSLPGLTGITRSLGMRVKSGQKRIPRAYLDAGMADRIDLLQGLMDGDGSRREAQRRSVNYSTTSIGLADDMRELVTSLGGTANISTAIRLGKPVEYTLGIILPSGVDAFSSERKSGGGTQSVRNLQPRRAIVSVDYVGDKPIRCIKVAAADSLYLITRNHIVTHNTVVFTHLAERFLKANPGKRVLILAHTDELVLQAKAKMHEVAPERVVGIVKAERNEVSAEVVVASVQSLRSKARRDRIKAVGLIIVDECHHASARTYMTILEHYGAIFPEVEGIDTRVHSNVPVLAVGFTATLVRADDKKLSDVWQDVAFRLSIAFMIRAGYLLDVKGHRVQVPQLDLKKVHTSGGDYKEGELADALVEAMAPEIVAKAYLEHASDRKGIGFAPTVDSAYIFSDAFKDLGITSEVVHGALAKDERRGVLARLKSGETQVCWSVMALTEGFDEPTVSCAIMARPTKSSGLWQQMVGRVLRPDLSLAPAERGHALLLDVTGVGRMHGLQSLVDLSSRDDLPEDVDEDLSLLELEDLILEEERAETGAAEPTMYYMGPAETVEFDPLGRDSDRAWGRTPDGAYYLTAGSTGYVFLTESLTGEPGSYDLVWCAKEPGGPAQMTGHNAVHLEMGIAWGEEEAIERGGFGSKVLTAKKAKWRNDPCTKGQAYMVRQVPGWGGGKIRTEREDPNDQFSEVKRYWIAETGETLTKGKASEIIDGHAAAQRIDSLVRQVRASVGK